MQTAWVHGRRKQSALSLLMLITLNRGIWKSLQLTLHVSYCPAESVASPNASHATWWAADLMVVVISVIVEQINNMDDFAHFLLITPICALTNVVRMVAMDCSVWFTVAFTSDRGIAICCQKLRKEYCTEKTAAVVIVAVTTVSCVSPYSSPWSLTL